MATLPYLLDDEPANSSTALPYLQTDAAPVKPRAAGIRAPEPEVGGFVDAVQRTAGQTIKGLGQVGADYIPGVDQDNVVSQYGQEVIDANPAGVNRLRDIVDKPWTAVKEATGNAGAFMGGMVGARALGTAITAASPLAGPAAPAVAAVGQGVSWLGPLAIAALPSYSGIRDKQILNDPDAQTSAKDKAVAALGAATVGAIEQRFGPQNWAMAAMTKEGRAKVAEMLASTTLRGSIGKGVARGAAVEGAEELVQNPVEQLAAYDNPLTGENLEETAFGGAMGALGGGVLGGGFGAVAPRGTRSQVRDQAQTTLLKKLLPGDAAVSVQNDVVAVVLPTGRTVTGTVKEVGEHLAAGKPIEELQTALDIPTQQPASFENILEERDASQFANESRAYTQGANEQNRLMNRTMQDYAGPELPTDQRRMRWPGSVGEAVSVSTEDAEAAAFEREAQRVNQVRNTREQRRQFPGTAVSEPSLEEGLAATYRPELPPREPQDVITNLGGRPFPSEATAIGAAARQEEGVFEAVPEGEGFVARRLDTTGALTRPNGEGFSSVANLELAARRSDTDLSQYEVKQTSKGFMAVPLAAQPSTATPGQAEVTDDIQLDTTPDVSPQAPPIAQEAAIAPTPPKAEGAIEVASPVTTEGGRTPKGAVGEPEITGTLESEQAATTKDGRNRAATALIEAGATVAADNPGGSWLAEERGRAAKKDQKEGLRHGSVTATIRNVELPVDELLKIKGMLGEHNRIDQKKVDKLAADIKANGLKNAPFINIGYDGTALVNEGNHRIRAAKKAGLESIPVDISYFAGGERVGGPLTVERVAELSSKLVAPETQRENLRQADASPAPQTPAVPSDEALTTEPATSQAKTQTTLGELLKTTKENKGITGKLATLMGRFIPGSKLNIPVTIDPQARSAAYNARSNSITVRDTSQHRTALHEITHGVTAREMENNPIVKARVKRLMATVKQEIIDKRMIPPALIFGLDDISTSQEFKNRFPPDTFNGKEQIAYALLNEREFLAQAMSSQEFQNLLKKIPIAEVKGKPHIRVVWDSFIDIIMSALGIKATHRDAFGEAISIVAELAQMEATAVNEFAQPNMALEKAIDRIQNLPAFREWFGDSKVVDENGDPLPVYHGTGEQFAAFSPDVDPTNYETDRGVFHFTNFRGIAEAYSEFSGPFGEIENETPRVIEAYVALKNPLVVDNVSSPIEEWDDSGDIYLNQAKNEGRDGIIIQTSPASDGRDIEKLVIAFSPTQIKSIFNTRWNPANPDIMESLDAAATSVSAAHSIRDNVAQTLADPKAKWHDVYLRTAPARLAVTPLQTLVKLWGEKIPQVKTFYRHVHEELVRIKDELINTSAELSDKAESLAKDGPGMDTFNDAALTATFYQMDPTKDMMEQDWVPAGTDRADRIRKAGLAWTKAGMDEATGLKFAAAYQASVKAYKALGSEELKQAYTNIVGHMAQIREREKNNLLAEIERTTEEGSTLRKQLMDRFDSTFNNLKGAYWPLSRWGEYTLSYKDADGVLRTENVDTPSQQRILRDRVLAEGADPNSIKMGVKDKQPRGVAGIPGELMSQLTASVEQKFMADVDLSDKEAVADARSRAQDAIEGMNQTFFRWQPETSALKNSLRRGNRRGFDADAVRSYRNYVQHHASSIAWSEQGRKLDADIKSLADTIKEAKTGEDAADTRMQQHILNDLRARVHALRTARVGSFNTFMGRMATGYYMTSPSIALVQMSQLGILTLPKLAVKFNSLPGSMAALRRGMAAAFNKKYTRDKFFDDPVVGRIHMSLRETVTPNNRHLPQAKGKELGDMLYSKYEITKQIAKLTPYQRQLLVLREATARNLLDVSAAHEQFELTKGKDPNSFGSKTFKLAMLPMRLSELASRKTAVLATMELSEKKGKDFFATMDDVAEVVNDTLFSYAAENKGTFMLKEYARLPMQFQWFNIMSMIRMGLLFRDSVKGETAEIKSDARKEFLGIMGASAALAGTLGVPGANLLMGALALAMGDDDEPEDVELNYANWARGTFGEKLGDVLLNGLPAAAGTNLTRRIGLGDMYGMRTEPPPWMHGQELAAWWALNLLGPSFSVPAGWIKGYDKIANRGELMRGLEDATPKPIRDAIKAMRVSSEGVKTGAGLQLLAQEKIDSGDIALMALGFSPKEIAKAQSAQWSSAKLSTAITARRGRLTKNAAKAILTGEGREQALADIRKFNSKMPRFAIQGSEIRTRARGIIKGERGIRSKRERDIIAQYEVPVY